MSDVNDRNVIDHMLMEDKNLILVILDPLQWDYSVREQHCYKLQDKINDYLQFIASGQIAEHQKEEEYKEVVIRIIARYSYSRYCLDFFERCGKWIKENGELCRLEWTHPAQENGEDAEFQDGFCDDYVFAADKVYPRIKKNWAKKPLEAVTLMAPENNFYDENRQPDFSDSPMFRIYDSYVIALIQDMGSTYLYLTYENIPENISMEQLEEKAFENLRRDVTYRMVESTKESGVYGLVAGGDFEVEALCLPGIWEDCSRSLQGDLLIAVPTKDLVLFTKADDRKPVRKMMKMAQKTWEHNRKVSPDLIFSQDVFYYDRNAKQLEISRKYSI